VLLQGSGLDAFSVSALARQLGVTPSAILQRRSRRDLLRDAVLGLGHRWTEWCGGSSLSMDLPGNLPRDEHARHAIHVWQALQEVARGAAAGGDHELQQLVCGFWDQEVERIEYVLVRLIARPPTDLEVAEALVLLDGLRSELARPGSRLTPADADSLLRAYVDRLRQAAA
jgi:hypothetical protein